MHKWRETHYDTGYMTLSIFRIHTDDTVAVALRDLARGEACDIGDGAPLAIGCDVAKGHKIALNAHAPGDAVIRYGQPIGRATAPIAPGDWVHSHNLATNLTGADGAAPVAGASAGAAASDRRWMGYARGPVAGTRNEIWIFPTVGCVARTAEQVARIAAERHRGRVDGVHAFTHPFGCSQLGDDLDGTRAILASLAQHANAGGVLFIGLGCESNQMAALLEGIPPLARQRIRSVVAQQLADETAAALAAVDELVEQAAAERRVSLPVSALSIGLKCGGSDGFSGLTANPLLGRLTETVTASGGQAILTEIPEIFGAEHLLLGRAASAGVTAAGLRLVADFKRYFTDHGEPVSENPSPGNIAGGITTLEEKSLGAVQKAGRAQVTDVRRYGERADKAGLTLLEAPGNDAVSSTALAAAGANLILFTTGRGTPLGFPVPTIKVASNSELAQRKPNWIDFDAGPALEGDVAALDRRFLDHVLAVASGQETAAEKADQREMAIWKRGVTL